jgi:hypothetical protein
LLFDSMGRHLTGELHRATGPSELGLVGAAQTLAALALGAAAIGALAIGAVAIGRLAVGRARIRRLEIDELVVRRLRVVEALDTPAQPGPES